VRSKTEIREMIWSLMEKEKVARFPGARGRIPNFIGAETCASLAAETQWWQQSKVLKVNPDSPQRAIRHRALAQGKIVYMAVPRLRANKPFIELDPKKLDCTPYTASSIKGASKHGRPVALKDVKPIDLVICGSVAVNRAGARIGKGGGYSDLEFALLTEHRKIAPRTPIATSVHPLQIVDEEIPMTQHDIPLTAVITPNGVITMKARFKRPKGIYWGMLSEEKIDAIPVLKAKIAKLKRS
jgi:5-formyltetrahydrofolate cyclo-ligase